MYDGDYYYSTGAPERIVLLHLCP